MTFDASRNHNLLPDSARDEIHDGDEFFMGQSVTFEISNVRCRESYPYEGPRRTEE